jgi:hypothetical protein
MTNTRISNKQVYEVFKVWQKARYERCKLNLWKRLDKTWVIYSIASNKDNVEIKGNKKFIYYLLDGLKKPLYYPQHFPNRINFE